MTWLEIRRTWDGLDAAPAEWARVGLLRDDAGVQVHLEAPCHGDPPPPGPAGPTPGLWDFEVVELFLCGSDGRYVELEVGPEGHHLVLLLAGVRQPAAQALPLDCTWTRTAERWSARALLPAAWLPALPWTANAYAMHGTGPARHYLACHPVPGDGPDFHRLHLFPPLTLEAR